MAIAYRASAGSIAWGDTTSLVCDKPTGTTTDDVLLAFVNTYDNPSSDVTPPSGWTEITAGNIEVSNLVARTFIKVAGGSEPSTYTFTLNNMDVGVIVIGAWSGCNTTTPQDATATGASGTGTNRTATGVTTATANAVIVVGSAGHTQALSAGFSGMTERLTWAPFTGSSVIFDQAIAAPGATGNKAATSSADANGWTATLVALRPAGAAAASFLPPAQRMPLAILAR